MVDPDPDELVDRLDLGRVGRVRQDEGDPRVDRQVPADVGSRSCRPARCSSVPGTCAVGEPLPDPGVDDGDAIRHRSHQSGGIQSRRPWSGAEDRWSLPVARRHVGVVRRIRPEAGQHVAHEDALVGRRCSHGLSAALRADRRGPLRPGGARAAEAARPMGRQQPNLRGQRGQLAQRVELGAGQAVGRGPARGGRSARPSRPAGSRRSPRRPVRRRRHRSADVPGQVLRRVAGRRPGPQVDIADDRARHRRRPAGAGSRTRLGPGPGSRLPWRGTQLEGAGQVVVVDVGLDDVGDPPAARRGRRIHVPRVAGRIDRRPPRRRTTRRGGSRCPGCGSRGSDVHQPVRPITGRHRRRSVR